MKTNIAELTAQLSAENEKVVAMTTEVTKANVRGSHNNEMSPYHNLIRLCKNT